MDLRCGCQLRRAALARRMLANPNCGYSATAENECADLPRRTITMKPDTASVPTMRGSSRHLTAFSHALRVHAPPPRLNAPTSLVRKLRSFCHLQGGSLHICLRRAQDARRSSSFRLKSSAARNVLYAAFGANQ